MISKIQKIRLGIFILVTLILLIAFFVIVIGNKLIEKKDYYYVHYKDVSVNGLQLGSSVKFYGIRIGSVEDIVIDREDIRNVIVEIGIKRGTPIKEDAYATLVSVGITGLKQIELTGGTNEAELLEPGAQIQAGSSYLDDITGKAEDIAEKLELLIINLGEITNENNRARITSILNSGDAILQENRAKITLLLDNINRIVEENRQPIRSSIEEIGLASQNLNRLTVSANESIEKLNAILDSEEIRNVLRQTSDFSDQLTQVELIELIEDLRTAINQINTTFTHIDLTVLKGRTDLLESLDVIKETADYLNEFSRQISEDPSFLIRSKK